VTKIAASTFWEDIFEGRSMNTEDLSMYTNMALDAVRRFEQINNNVPKRK